MADAIVSEVAGRIISLIEEQARHHINLVRGAEKEVRKLADDLETVRNVLDDAENQRYKEKSVQNWLVRLEQTSYEMDDVLDEWNHAILKLKIEQDASHDAVVALKQKVWSFIPSSSCLCFKKAALRHGIAKKIVDVKEKLDKVLKEKDRFKWTISHPTSGILPNSWRDKSTSFADLEVVHGRDSDRDILVTKLTGRQEELRVRVVSIVGVGGLGKTTLAQIVYNDSRVEKSFDLMIWICVSDPFDLIAIANGILQNVGSGSSSDADELDVLLRDVKKSILGKRFLLVLDDVWTEDSKKWEPLKSSLKYGGTGSKVLVTTRNQNVAEIMGSMDGDIHHLGKLSDEECWRLLSNEAFSGRSREKFEELKDMSEGIAKKCKGLPLAAKVLGSLLRSKSSLEAWENVLNSEIWQLEKVELELFPHLLLSYNELSPMHKRCFSYCAVFPKDSVIDVEELIEKWMAVGYLGSNTCDMELKGRECFEFLAMRSLFQDFEKDNLDGQIWSCKMHDIVHDFAQFLRKKAPGLNSATCGSCDPFITFTVNEFCSFSFSYSNAPQKLCNCLKRLRVLTLERVPQGIENLIHLRWLKLDGNTLSVEDLKIIFRLYNLQTLSLRNCKMKEIPSEIGSLIHLRFLDVSYNFALNELPESICSLKELRTLNVRFCSALTKLPEGMHRLVNLKHLHNDRTPNLEKLPQGLAQVTGLHTLGKFHGGGNGLNKLGLLKNLNLLTGRLNLRIRLADDCLEDAVNDAREAELRRKIHVQEIYILFDNERNNEETLSILLLDIIEALEPQPNLKRLTIESYFGRKLPAWIASPPLNHLRRIAIHHCDYISSLPSLGKLQCLEDIMIFSMDALRFVGREFLGITTIGGGGGDMDIQSASAAFPKLKNLTFSCCSNWVEWEDITAEEEESVDVLFMPCLTNLKLELCSQLTVLPHRLLRKASTLEVLDLSNSEKLQQSYGDKDCSVGKSVFRNPRLQINWM